VQSVAPLRVATEATKDVGSKCVPRVEHGKYRATCATSSAQGRQNERENKSPILADKLYFCERETHLTFTQTWPDERNVLKKRANVAAELSGQTSTELKMWENKTMFSQHPVSGGGGVKKNI
jgi:hypothetical protein